jgi:hypothetical protein
LLSSQQLDGSSLIDAVVQRLQVHDCEDFPLVLKACGTTTTGLYFKILLCRRIIQSSDPGSHARPRAQPKSRPLPRARAKAAKRTAEDDLPVSTPAPTEASSVPTERRIPGLPDAIIRIEEVSDLLAYSLPKSGAKSNHAPYHRAKLELLVAYVRLRCASDDVGEEQSQSTWLNGAPLVEAVRSFCDAAEAEGRIKKRRPSAIWDPTVVRSAVSVLMGNML